MVRIIDQRAATSRADGVLALHRLFEENIFDVDVPIWLDSLSSQSGDELRNLNNRAATLILKDVRHLQTAALNCLLSLTRSVLSSNHLSDCEQRRGRCEHQARAGLFVGVASQRDGHHVLSTRAGGRSRQPLPHASGRQGACCSVNAESSVVRNPVSFRARLAEAS